MCQWGEALGNQWAWCLMRGWRKGVFLEEKGHLARAQNGWELQCV